MFGYPGFEGDEGIYTSQAWWLVHFGKLAPYTYWYDHAPFGWLFIGLWQLATGGPFRFGLSLFSSRIFMVVLSVLTNMFIFFTVLRLAQQELAVRATIIRDGVKKLHIPRSYDSLAYLAAFGAAWLFAFSPLAVFFHRRVLLDNIMTFWLALSVFFLTRDRPHLKDVWMSGIFFGIAFLSKETALVLFPVWIFSVFRLSRRKTMQFGMLIAGFSFFFLSSLFPLMALLKGEFFPSCMISTQQIWQSFCVIGRPLSWNGLQGHVSFLQTVGYQVSRGDTGPLWSPYNAFRVSLNSWLYEDPWIVVIGIFSVVWLLLPFKHSFHTGTHNGKHTTLIRNQMLALMGVSYIAFLARGRLTIDFYIIPLLYLFAVCFGLALFHLIYASPMRVPAGAVTGYQRLLQVAMWLLVVGCLTYGAYYFIEGQALYTSSITKAQIASIYQAKSSVPENAVIVVDAWAFMDLKLPFTDGGRALKNTEWFSKVVLDPEVIRQLNNDWRTINYILLSNELVQTMRNEKNPSLLTSAFNHSAVTLDYPPKYPESRDIKALKSLSADWVTLMQVNVEGAGLIIGQGNYQRY